MSRVDLSSSNFWDILCDEINGLDIDFSIVENNSSLIKYIPGDVVLSLSRLKSHIERILN